MRVLRVIELQLKRIMLKRKDFSFHNSVTALVMKKRKCGD